tara:strand:- start:10 stop:612 length:603 start_codon:yes stop_codon:yes gene_type:complete
MPHIPGHNEQYVIQSTGQPYNGLVFRDTNGEIYSTITGAREGFNGVGPGGQLLVLTSESTIQPSQQQTAVGDENPVTRLFTAPATPRYYLSNGTLVSIGTKLHQHANGTVMLAHNMNNPVIVTTVPPNGSRNRTNGLSQTAGRRTRSRRPQNQNQTRTQRQNNMNRRRNTTQTPTRTSTRTGTMNTRRRTSGGSGGGSGY